MRPSVAEFAEVASPDLVSVLVSFAAHARADVHAERFFDKAQDRWGYKPVHEPLTPDHLRKHLNGAGPHLGVYFINPGSGKTRLATLDFDAKDGNPPWEEMRARAVAVAETARKFGLNPWPVRSGGGNGVHLHFLWDREQSAAAVRRVLETVLNAEGFSNGTGGVGKGEVEIFPKQDRVDAASPLGNLIALPFARKSEPLNRDLQPAAELMPWVTSAPVPEHEERSKAERKREHAGDGDIGALREALDSLSAHDYHRWIRYGLALKNGLGEEGFAIWDEWSSTAANYAGADTVRKKWSTFRPSNSADAITVSSIFYDARLAGWAGPPPARSNLPKIQIKEGDLPRMVDEAEAALLAANAELYKQGSRVVRIIWDKGKTASGGITSVLRVADVLPAHLLERLAHVACWLKWDARGKRLVAKDCPKIVVEVYLARDGDWKLPPLLGVVSAPTLRPDGTVLGKPGYDEATGLVYHSRGVEFPPVPEKPSREEALRALALLKEPFKEFPFVPGANLAVALSDVITTLIRRSLPVAPMHAYTSPTAGTGKSLAVDIASIVATGERAAVTTLGRDKWGDAELEKRLVSSLLAGDAVLSIDNLDSPLRGDFLCAMLSQERLKLRPLGKSIQVEVTNTSSYHATGNNMIIEGDATRRVLLSRMDAGVERPELRSFKFNVLDFVRERRGDLVAAALTVVRAYLVSGEKQQELPLGGYDDWSRLVRDPLLWIGEADPVDVMEKVRQGDPLLGRLKSLVAAWQAVFGEQTIMVRDVIAKGLESLPPQQQDRDTLAYYKNADLHEALNAVAGDGRGDLSPEKLGWWLRKNNGRAVGIGADGGDSYRFIQQAMVHNVATWKLERIGGSGGGQHQLAV